MRGLSPLQERFVQEYLKDLNASAAYQRAGYKARGHGAESAAHRLLRNVEVVAAINQAKERRAKRLDITADRVLEEAARLAFLDIRKLYDDAGNLKPVSQWDDEVAAAVSGIETLQQYEYVEGQRVPAGVLKKVHTWSKPSQLKLLAQHLQLLHEEPASNVVNIQINVRTSLAEALHHAYSPSPTLPSNGYQPGTD